MMIFEGIGKTAYEVFIALLPVVVIFFSLQLFGLKIKKERTFKIMTGFAITYIGLVLFLHGVHLAFIPIGTHLGSAIAKMENNYILIPLGFMMGFVVAFAEPAVHVLNNQVFELSSGSIKKTLLLLSISIGVAIAVSLAMVRVLFDLSLWWFVIPGYIIIFILSKFVDPTFSAIAFDSGGVATGPMCATFVLSFTIAVAEVLSESPEQAMMNGLGMVSLVAMAPIISLMTLSFLYQTKLSKKALKEANEKKPVTETTES